MWTVYGLNHDIDPVSLESATAVHERQLLPLLHIHVREICLGFVKYLLHSSFIAVEAEGLFSIRSAHSTIILLICV